jgi:hypothetical protein
MSTFARFLLPVPQRARCARLLLALWTMLVLPVLAHPLHAMDKPLTAAVVTASEHCAGHPSPAPTDATHSCLCLQACASAVVALATGPVLPQAHTAAAPQFAIPNNALPASPSSTPYRPPIAAYLL